MIKIFMLSLLFPTYPLNKHSPPTWVYIQPLSEILSEIIFLSDCKISFSSDWERDPAMPLGRPLQPPLKRISISGKLFPRGFCAYLIFRTQVVLPCVVPYRFKGYHWYDFKLSFKFEASSLMLLPSFLSFFLIPSLLKESYNSSAALTLSFFT